MGATRDAQPIFVTSELESQILIFLVALVVLVCSFGEVFVFVHIRLVFHCFSNKFWLLGSLANSAEVILLPMRYYVPEQHRIVF